MLNILYCSYFRSHRAHRELVRLAGDYNCRITSVPWEDSEKGNYTGPFPVDGMISHLEPGRYGLLRRSTGEVPSVTLHSSTADRLKVPGVVCDHVAAGRMVAEHFIALGFRKFAAFVDTASYSTFDDRYAGYLGVINEAGLQAPERVALSEALGRSYPKTLRLFGKALRSMPVPLAIMAANDRAAVKIMDACEQNHLSIPAQVAVCGFDNDPITCDVAPVPLSSVDTDPELQAREAFALLMDMLRGRAASRKPVLIPPKKLVVRRSSGLQAQESAVVAKAVAYIHEHAWEPSLDIPKVVDRAGVSRTSLFQAFRRSLSVTPLQYITNLRLEKAQRLLKETELKINDIRPRCGFASDYQMYRAFIRTTGKSPGSFR